MHGVEQSVERTCLAECLVTNVAGGLRLLEYIIVFVIARCWQMLLFFGCFAAREK